LAKADCDPECARPVRTALWLLRGHRCIGWPPTARGAACQSFRSICTGGQPKADSAYRQRGLTFLQRDRSARVGPGRAVYRTARALFTRTFGISGRLVCTWQSARLESGLGGAGWAAAACSRGSRWPRLSTRVNGRRPRSATTSRYDARREALWCVGASNSSSRRRLICSSTISALRWRLSAHR
jgi:hypothetical protein